MESLNLLQKVSEKVFPAELNPIVLINNLFDSFPPWQIAIVSIFATQGIVLIIKTVQCFIRAEKRKIFFRWIKKIPFVRKKIEKELSKKLKEMEKDLSSQLGGLKYNRNLPEKGWSKDKVLDEVKKCMDLGEYRVEKGSLSGICHKPPNPERVETVTGAYAVTAFANPLNPDAFPGIRKMEAEVVRMTLNLFGGDENACGTMTSGGTESLLLACKAYRDYARANKGITKPNIVVSKSAHVSFDKAGKFFGIEIRHIPMNENTWQPDLDKFKRAMDSNTIMVVASAPQYPQGVMDPIVEIGKMAMTKGVPMHVDACLGGFLLVFMKRSGYQIDPFDFSVDGVTSISADTHKFGYAPKGSSVIMYKEKKYIHHQYYVDTDSSGGIYVSPTLAGSRSGGIIAATWACLMNFGLDGYLKKTEEIVSTLKSMVDGIRKIQGLRILGDPKVCVVSFTSDDFHIYLLGDEMKERGWLLSNLQHPTCVHFYVTPMHTQPGIKEKFLKDLSEVTEKLRESGKTKLDGRAAVYGMAQTLPDRDLVEDMVAEFVDALYTTKDLDK